MDENQHSHIRSFVRRQGRLTPGQKTAYDELWSIYGITWEETPPDFSEWFEAQQPTYLEIGFGNGSSLFQMAKAFPRCNFIGIEVHTPGIGHLLVQLKDEPLSNLKIICHDVIEILPFIPERSLSGLHIYFPDPWPKKKHHKRRLIQPLFVDKMLLKLNSQGYIHAATDWQEYAEHIETVFTDTPEFTNCSLPDFACPTYRPTTKFERRGTKKGHGIWDIIFAKSADYSPLS